MNNTLRQFAVLCMCLAALAALVGCGLGTSTSQAIAPAGPVAVALKGLAHGGQMPISGASVQLYAVGTTGYGSAATSLNALNGSGQPVTTDSNGNFYVGSFTCSSPCTSNSMVYIVLAGGNPGLTAGTNNTSAVLLSALGTESNVHSISFVWVNEVTTAATAYALAPFYGTDALHIGTSSSNITGIANAFTTAQNLVNITNGQAGGPNLPAGATVSQDSLYAISDILANCVNSAGGVSGDSSSCGNLFAQTGGSATTDITMAAAYMAQHPTSNVSALFSQITATPVFATSIASAPNDWTLTINYAAGSNLNNPGNPAVDASGNIWVPSIGNSAVTELNPVGAVAANLTLASPPNALAVDTSGYVWVAAGTNSGNSKLFKLTSSDTLASTYSGNGLNNPTGISIDNAGDLWLSNAATSQLSAFTSSGAALSGSPFSGGGLSAPVSIVSASH